VPDCGKWMDTSELRFESSTEFLNLVSRIKSSFCCAVVANDLAVPEIEAYNLLLLFLF
jgi:hypothetical protein